MGIGQTRDRHHRRVRRAAGPVAGGGTESPAARARGPGHGCGHHLFGTASTAAAIAVKDWLVANKRCGTLAVLRHARRGRRLGQGLHAARGSLRRRRRRGDDASGRSQCVERVEHARERHRQVPVPRPVRACLDRARSRALGARRRRSDERHGQPDARARAVGRAHSLRDHQRRPRPQRRSRFRRGLLLRASQRHARARRHLGADHERRARRRAGHGHHDGTGAHRRGVERPAEQLPRRVDAAEPAQGRRLRVHARRTAIRRHASEDA